jgi:hypothetical protein
MTITMTITRTLAGAIASLVLAGGFGSAAWAADLIVLEARGVALRPGQSVDSTQILLLKQGQHVTLISPSGTTLKLDGPYEKPPGADQGRGMPVASALSLLVTQRQARTGEVGTTRGNAPNTLPEPWLLDASRAGTVCLRDNSDAVLWRPDSRRDTELTVAPADRSWKTNAHWPAGTDRIMVAAPAMIHGGTTYLVTLDGAQTAMKVESVPANLPNDQVRAAWLAGKDCEAQAQALLRNQR